MRAIAIAAPGGPEVLTLVERPVPKPGSDEVLIRVAAAGINRPDILQRQGRYAPPPGTSDLPGLEVAGEIVSVGPATPGAPARWQAGDRVCALLAGGGYAEFATAPAGQCLPIPESLSMVEAAALPETVFTVWTNVVDRGRLRAGETLLVHGGASGIGTVAIQIARALGARAIATAGSAAKCRACEALGAERAIDRTSEDFVTVVHALTGGQGVDVILDIVGGDYTARNLASLAMDGRLVQIAYLRGPAVQIDLSLVMRRRLTITGSTLRPRAVAEKSAIARAVEETIWPHVAAGGVRPVIDATFPLAQAADAHRRLEAGEHVGKIVLEGVRPLWRETRAKEV